MTIDNFIEKHARKIMVGVGAILLSAVSYQGIKSIERHNAEPVRAEIFLGEKYNNINIIARNGTVYTLECENPIGAPRSGSNYRPMTIHR